MFWQFSSSATQLPKVVFRTETRMQYRSGTVFVIIWKYRFKSNRLQQVKSNINMAEMDVFALLQKHFVMCGINMSEKSTKMYPFNMKNTIAFIMVWFYISLTIALLNEANDFGECADILFRSVSVSACNFDYVIIVCSSSKLNAFIDSFTDVVNKRE